MLTLKVTTIAGCQVLVPDAEARQCLQLQDGDILCLTEAPDGRTASPHMNQSSCARWSWLNTSCTDDHEIIRELLK